MDKEQYEVTTEEVTTYLNECQQLHQDFNKALPEVESLQEIIELNWDLAAGLLNAFETLRSGPDLKH